MLFLRKMPSKLWNYNVFVSESKLLARVFVSIVHCPRVSGKDTCLKLKTTYCLFRLHSNVWPPRRFLLQKDARFSVRAISLGRRNYFYIYLFSTAVEIYCWPCDPVMRRDIDDKRQSRLHYCRCGNLLYNPDTHLCCRDRRYPKYHGHLCCGERTYNCYSQLCCEGGVRNKIGNECCGLVQFLYIHVVLCSHSIPNFLFS